MCPPLARMLGNRGWLSRTGLLGLAVLSACVAAGPVSAQSTLGFASKDGKLPFDAYRDWTNYNNIGHRALLSGNLDRAASAFRLAIETVRPFEATERVLMARSNADYADVLYREKRYDEAEPLARWALLIRKQTPGARSEALTQNYRLLARIERARQRSAEAATLLKEALTVQEKAIGPYHSDLITTLEEIADLHSELGALTDAEKSYRRALALRELNSERNLKEAERLELRAQLLRDVATADNGVLGYQGNTSLMRDLEAQRLETLAHTVREASAVSHTSAATAQRYAVTLRKAGKPDEADDMEVRARAMRDEAETRAARDRAGR